ncbi:MlaD family protein [Gordonia polyisoprenivorans]|uniref:MlaD family protein n=1 Tax=Gordonia polyisoprenivorans TaxID=84595 RepID=UPI001AD757DE|nr:MlaD family protein [Gordonia polyisoprenivorans]QTI68989.1 MCE family protein [Gordonia polyisoprenivorans]
MVIVIVMVFVKPMLSSADPSRLVVMVDTPGVGVGVSPGSPVVLNGVRIGTVTNTSLAAGGASMTLDMDQHSVDGLRADFGFDFRPANYFGVSAVTITNAGDGAAPLVHSGDRLQRPLGRDYTMGTMIDYGSEFVNGSLLASTTEAIKRSLAYSAALEPLINTGVTVADVVSRTQTAVPSELISDYNDIATALPPFTLGAIDAVHTIYNSDMRFAGDEIIRRCAESYKAIADTFFTLVGRLLKSNEANLTPAVDLIRQAGEVLPAIGAGVLTPATLRTLLERMNGAFGPADGGGRTLRVKLALNSIPILDTAAMSPLLAGTGR